MAGRTALRTAIELFHMPSRVRTAREEPLPPGVVLLLRIAAGEQEAQEMAVASTGRSRDLIRHAAVFFIEQVLLYPNSDSYRVLGADLQAGTGDLRRNMALLVKWLHPDKDPEEQRSVFVSRINQAWNDLKTPERRAKYDQIRGPALAQKRSMTSRKSKTRASSKRVFQSYHAPFAEPPGLLRRAWLFLLRAASL